MILQRGIEAIRREAMRKTQAKLKEQTNFQSRVDAMSKHNVGGIYYVRAIEEPIETIASDPLGCEYDENGKCIKTKICRLGHKKHNECLAPSEHRAWSSPIFVNYRS